MSIRILGGLITLAVAAAVVHGLLPSRSILAASTTLAELTGRTHFHGIEKQKTVYEKIDHENIIGAFGDADSWVQHGRTKNLY